MLAKNVTQNQLFDVLAEVNRKFDGNIKFKDIETTNKGVKFTLTVNDCRGKGGRWNHTKTRRVCAACWHVHGEFFDLMPEGSYVIANGEKTRPGDSWKDWNMGSVWQPAMYSTLCDCE